MEKPFISTDEDGVGHYRTHVTSLDQLDPNREEPDLGGHASVKVELDKDSEYMWCTCGRSMSQPFCDRSHTHG